LFIEGKVFWKIDMKKIIYNIIAEYYKVVLGGEIKNGRTTL
jgi:hypothetical protein